MKQFVVEVDASSSSVMVVEQGSVFLEFDAALSLPGPPGPQGPPGTAGYTATFSASSTWTVNHNLGRAVAVVVRDAGSAQIIANVTHTSLNQFVVQLTTPTAGSVVVT